MMALFLLIAFISEAITAIQDPVCPNRHWVTVLDGYYLSLLFDKNFQFIFEKLSSNSALYEQFK